MTHLNFVWFHIIFCCFYFSLRIIHYKHNTRTNVQSKHRSNTTHTIHHQIGSPTPLTNIYHSSQTKIHNLVNIKHNYSTFKTHKTSITQLLNMTTFNHHVLEIIQSKSIIPTMEFLINNILPHFAKSFLLTINTSKVGFYNKVVGVV